MMHSPVFKLWCSVMHDDYSLLISFDACCILRCLKMMQCECDAGWLQLVYKVWCMMHSPVLNWWFSVMKLVYNVWYMMQSPVHSWWLKLVYKVFDAWFILRCSVHDAWWLKLVYKVWWIMHSPIPKCWCSVMHDDWSLF